MPPARSRYLGYGSDEGAGDQDAEVAGFVMEDRLKLSRELSQRPGGSVARWMPSLLSRSSRILGVWKAISRPTNFGDPQQMHRPNRRKPEEV